MSLRVPLPDPIAFPSLPYIAQFRPDRTSTRIKGPYLLYLVSSVSKSTKPCTSLFASGFAFFWFARTCPISFETRVTSALRRESDWCVNNALGTSFVLPKKFGLRPNSSRLVRTRTKSPLVHKRLTVAVHSSPIMCTIKPIYCALYHAIQLSEEI